MKYICKASFLNGDDFNQENINSFLKVISLYISEAIKFNPILENTCIALSNDIAFDLDGIVFKKFATEKKGIINHTLSFLENNGDFGLVTYRKLIDNWENIGALNPSSPGESLRLFYLEDDRLEIQNKEILALPMQDARLAFKSASFKTIDKLGLAEGHQASLKESLAMLKSEDRTTGKELLPSVEIKSNPIRGKSIQAFVNRQNAHWTEFALNEYNPGKEDPRTKKGQVLHDLVMGYVSGNGIGKYLMQITKDDIEYFVKAYPDSLNDCSCHGYSHFNDIIRFTEDPAKLRKPRGFFALPSAEDGLTVAEMFLEILIQSKSQDETNATIESLREERIRFLSAAETTLVSFSLENDPFIKLLDIQLMSLSPATPAAGSDIEFSTTMTTVGERTATPPVKDKEVEGSLRG